MVKGIGIDLVDLAEFRRICEGFEASCERPCAFVARTFTAAELAQARTRHDACQYLAGRFAVKEAVFKAVAPLTRGGFDLRRVECLDAASGQPQDAPSPSGESSDTTEADDLRPKAEAAGTAAHPKRRFRWWIPVLIFALLAAAAAAGFFLLRSSSTVKA